MPMLRPPTLPTLGPLAALALACGATPPEQTPPPVALHLNDLSVLFPLPELDAFDRLLGPTSTGPRGLLLPRARYDDAPLLKQHEDATTLYESLRVVAARIDPCFPALDDPACAPQLRLVFQPVIDSFGDVVTIDAAMHLFYALDEDELSELLRDLRALKPSAPESTEAAPLGVHPSLLAQGLDSAFANDLKTLLLRFAGEENLMRLTFMRVEGLNNSQWVFGGFDYRPSKTALAIRGVATSTQTFANIFVFDEADYVATVTPRPTPEDDISVLYNSTLARERAAEELKQAAEAALRIEHPARHTPESIDCVSCHVATGARLWAERNIAFDGASSPARFRSRYDLSLTSEVQEITAPLRAFGYFGARPAISQRTVNETAAIAEHLNPAP